MTRKQGRDEDPDSDVRATDGEVTGSDRSRPVINALKEPLAPAPVLSNSGSRARKRPAAGRRHSRQLTQTVTYRVSPVSCDPTPRSIAGMAGHM